MNTSVTKWLYRRKPRVRSVLRARVASRRFALCRHGDRRNPGENRVWDSRWGEDGGFEVRARALRRVTMVVGSDRSALRAVESF